MEHYDCDVDEISSVKYYELSKISTCKFTRLDLEMTKTEVKLLSNARAVEIKAFAVTGTKKKKEQNGVHNTPVTLELTDQVTFMQTPRE